MKKNTYQNVYKSFFFRDLYTVYGRIATTKREISSVAEGWLSTLCCWEAAVHTLDYSWKKMDVMLMMMMNMMMIVYTVPDSDASGFKHRLYVGGTAFCTTDIKSVK